MLTSRLDTQTNEAWLKHMAAFWHGFTELEDLILTPTSPRLAELVSEKFAHNEIFRPLHSKLEELNDMTIEKFAYTQMYK